MSGCVAGPDGRVRPDSSVFSREGTLPVATGLVGALVCNQLFKGHGSKEGWTAVCGIGGYFLGRSFTVQSNDVLETMRRDLSFLTSISERTANAITFTVPDRNGDGVPECLYFWTYFPR